MELIVLGRYAPFAPVGGTCTAYLVRSAKANILLDGGNGSLARLQEWIDPSDLTAVFVSHLHEDHIADLHSLQYAVWTAMKTGRLKAPVPIYAPLEPSEPRRWLEPLIPGTTTVLPLPVETELAVGDVTCRWARTDHPRPCWAIRISDGTHSVVYTGDTGTGIDLAPFASEADLLVTEATYTAATGAERSTFGHQTGAEAADLGRRAGVQRVLLSHLRPGIEPGQVLAEAQAVYPAAELAEENRVYKL